eukprot:4201355-Amphidinium_carterae.2
MVGRLQAREHGIRNWKWRRSECTYRAQSCTSTLKRLARNLCKKTSRQQYHKKGAVKEQSSTHIDYAFIKGDNDAYKATVLTMCETTTALGYATVVQKKGAVYDAIQAIKSFIVENGLQTTILQSAKRCDVAYG